VRRDYGNRFAAPLEFGKLVIGEGREKERKWELFVLKAC